MTISGRLLVAILAVVLMAPPAYPQSTNERLDELTRDVLKLSNAFVDMRDNAIAKNADTKALLEQILARFGAMDTSFQKIEGTLSGIRTADEKSARELGEARIAITELKKSVDSLNLGEALTSLNTRMDALRKQITALENVEQPLPDAREAYNSAWAALNQGFYTIAISEFKDFLARYPKDVRAPSAQLNIGNSYFALGKFDQAVLEYDATIQGWPESDTKCTALYKKGQTLVELRQTAPARKTLEDVVKECPNTAEASGASQLLKPPARGGRG